MNGRRNGDGKMNGLHGPKHERGDIDVNRFAGMRLENLQGETLTLCKDQYGCRYLQKKLEEALPVHLDMIFRETFGHFAELVTDPFGNYLCQKLLEYWMLISELLNRTRLEKLLPDSYGKYCIQIVMSSAEPSACGGIGRVLPLIRNTPYGKRVQNKLQREQLDGHNGVCYGRQSIAKLTLRNPNIVMSPTRHPPVHGAISVTPSVRPGTRTRCKAGAFSVRTSTDLCTPYDRTRSRATSCQAAPTQPEAHSFTHSVRLQHTIQLCQRLTCDSGRCRHGQPLSA
ncbi:hypothetical protein NM688_g6376 [Phlebia brevispora]|uniref:Uncharacterized protein n=1 Tax=Phlebia brevispora TaxID=194682 RepID=A0ACC1SGW9_9APHY|nr:hypothetical protein NM688_g6376 [Phlebia brevispora]